MSIDAAALVEMNRLRIAARIVSSTIHDANNALQIIGGSAEVLAMKTAFGEPELRRIGKIGEQSHRAATALNRLADFTRAEGPPSAVIDLGEVVDAGLALRDYAIHRATIAVSVDRPAAPCRVAGNRRSILQIVLNLVINAEDALATTASKMLQIAIASHGTECTVRVADNGAGLQGRALPPMTALPSPGSDLSGLGLWVSAHLAAAHHGRIELESPESGGAVTLRLPALA